MLQVNVIVNVYVNIIYNCLTIFLAMRAVYTETDRS